MCFSTLNYSAVQLGVSAKKIFGEDKSLISSSSVQTNDSQDTYHPGYSAVDWELCTHCIRRKGNNITLVCPESFSFRLWLVSHCQNKQGQIQSLDIFEVRGVTVVQSPKPLSINAVLNLAVESLFESFSLMECCV